MKQQQFEERYQHEWDQFESALDALESGKQKDRTSCSSSDASLSHPSGHTASSCLTPEQFVAAYRSLCQQLSRARARGYSVQLLSRLNHLVIRGHQLLYPDRRTLLVAVADYFIRDFPQAVRQNARLFGLSAALFLGVMCVMAIAVASHPQLVYSVLSVEAVSEMEVMYAPEKSVLGRERAAESDIQMFGFYVRNNTGIGFRTYAGGVFFGFGSLFFLVFNGVYLGAVAGHLIHIGYSESFFSFVAGHSAPELLAIVLAGVGGLKMGGALLFPRRQLRLAAFRRAAKESLQIVYGMAALFLLAAVIEAFWSPRVLEPAIKYLVGCLIWLAFILYFLRGGRSNGN